MKLSHTSLQTNAISRSVKLAKIEVIVGEANTSNPSHGEMAAARWAGRMLAKYDAATSNEPLSNASVTAYAKDILDDPEQLAKAVRLHGLHSKGTPETPESERAYYEKLDTELRKDDALMDRLRDEVRQERLAGNSSRSFIPGSRKGR